MVVEQTNGIQRRSLRAEIRTLEIQDSEDVDVLRRPAYDTVHAVNFTVKSKLYNITSPDWSN